MTAEKSSTTTTSATTTATTTTTTSNADMVNCEHCGKEILKSEAIYGPLGFPVCKECYESGAYIGTVAPPYSDTTTTSTTTTTTTTIVTVSSSSSTSASPSASVLYGDANTDKKVTVADAVAILQFIANGDKYKLTDEGRKNADCYNPGDGVTAKDALAIQMLDAHNIDNLPLIAD